jgi:hypothetical protein
MDTKNLRSLAILFKGLALGAFTISIGSFVGSQDGTPIFITGTIVSGILLITGHRIDAQASKQEYLEQHK